MSYTFVPEKKYAKAYGRNVKISTKSAAKLCRVIKNKPLSRAKRLLSDLVEGKRDLRGKYYTKTAKELLMLINSCEKNAEFLDLNPQRLFVHASAHTGTMIRRRRRRGAFGSKLKTANVEVMLVERGKERKADVKIVKTRKDLEKVVKEVAEKVKEKKLAEAKTKTQEAKEEKQGDKKQEAMTVTA
ncbi:MAG: hypothetical protein HYT72_04980 [Candidatus Aenigmarchaeota archaeon]|nr:hypothetical protein [Candidatus Aenigmarchaeota archaeon]